MPAARYFEGSLPGMPATDGSGVQLTRMVGNPALDMLDPFLMLDLIDSDDPNSYIAGFPSHPHRGFETVTVMLEGFMRHQDSVGNDGLLRPGDVQWMTAGRGIIHSELPEMIDGRLKGFQLWVNLPAKKKMMRPCYQDIAAEKISNALFLGGTARVIAGNYLGVNGPARVQIPVRILDVILEPETEWRIDPPEGSNLFMCIYGGSIEGKDRNDGSKYAGSPAVALFGGSGDVVIKAGDTGAAILYCEGRPIEEPIAKYGPFVMNTREELEKAIADFNAGVLANG